VIEATGADIAFDVDYSTMLARSVFCAAAPGDGFSTRAEDAILSGCLPVVICDNVDEKFAHVLDWGAHALHTRTAAPGSGQMDRQTGRQADRQTGRRATALGDGQMGGETDRQADRQTDARQHRAMGRRVRWLGRWTDRQTMLWLAGEP
jgi:Exostosin family